VTSDVSVDVWALDSDPIELLLARYSASAIKGGLIDYAEIRASLLFRDFTIYSVPIDVPPSIFAIPVLSKDWEKSEKLASGIIFVGLLPIELQLLVEAQLQAGISAKNDGNELILSASSPEAELLLVGRARVSAAGVEVGPQIAGGILSAGFYSDAKTGFIPDSDDARALFEVKPRVKSIYLKVGAYVKISKLKWCKKWGVPYPCGIEERDRKDFWFYDSDGALFDKEWTLVDKEAVLRAPAN
jgi:hypothetical protein